MKYMSQTKPPKGSFTMSFLGIETARTVHNSNSSLADNVCQSHRHLTVLKLISLFVHELL